MFTPFGPIIGVILLIPLGEILRGQLGGVLPGLHYFICGLVVVIVVLVLPRGIGPSLFDFIGRRRTGRAERRTYRPAVPTPHDPASPAARLR